jgi:hypothetical protein
MAAVLALVSSAPFAHAQGEDEDQPKEERSAVMVFQSVDSPDGSGAQSAGGAFQVTVGSDGGRAVKMFRMQDGKLVPVEGGGGAMTFVSDGGYAFGPMVFGGADFMGARFAEFKEAHPTADADDDGNISFQEMRAFRVAKAMSNSDAVLAQFPHADGNGDGMLDTEEAAQLAGPGFGHPTPMPSARLMLSADAPEGRIEIRDDEEDGANVSMDVSIEGADLEFGDTLPHQIKIATSSTMRDVAGERRTEFVQTVDEDGVAEMTLTVDGEELYQGPPPAVWLEEPDLVEPTREQVAEHMALLDEADSARFLDMHPEADEDGDGVASEEEQQAFRSALMARMLEAHDAFSGTVRDAAPEMPELRRERVEEALLAALDSEGADDPEVRKEIEQALARVRAGHGDVVAGIKREKGKDPWVALKDEFVRKHDFPEDAIELADEVCEAAIKARDKIIEQIDAIKTEHADVLAKEAERDAEPAAEPDADEEGDRDAEEVAESKPAKLIKRLEAKIEEIKQRHLIGGLEKIRAKIVR